MRVAVGVFALVVLAIIRVFAEAVVLAKAVLAPWLLLAVVRLTEGRGPLLMGKLLLVVLSGVKVSEGVEFLMVATSEGLWAIVEDIAGVVVWSVVDSASVEIGTASETSVWLIVSAEKAAVSSKECVLTVTKVPLGVAASTVVSLSLALVVVSGGSTVVPGVADSAGLGVNKVLTEIVVLVMCDFGSVESGKADVSRMDKAFTLVGL